MKFRIFELGGPVIGPAASAVASAASRSPTKA
jgi:hypothetical protein